MEDAIKHGLKPVDYGWSWLRKLYEDGVFANDDEIYDFNDGKEKKMGTFSEIFNSKKSIKSRYYMNDSRKFTLAEVAQYLASLFFDLRTIHFNSTGDDFYTYHALAEDLYEKTEDYYDDIVETAIGYDSDVSPMYVLPGDWIFVDEHGSFDTNGTVQTLILMRLQIIYDVLENVKEYDSMVQSKVDGMMEFYDKEIYKLTQVLK